MPVMQKASWYATYGELMLQVNAARNRCLINPTADTEVEEGDQLIMMRPTSISSDGYRALASPVKVDMGRQV